MDGIAYSDSEGSQRELSESSIASSRVSAMTKATTTTSECSPGDGAAGEDGTAQDESQGHEDNESPDKLEEPNIDALVEDGKTAATSSAASSVHGGHNEDEDLYRLQSDLQDDLIGFENSKNARTATTDPKLRNRQALSYFMLVEARIKELENEVSALKARPAADTVPVPVPGSADLEQRAPDMPDESVASQVPAKEMANSLEESSKTAKERWSVKPGWKTLYEFFDTKKASNPEPIIDVLTEAMRPLGSRRVKKIVKGTQHLPNEVPDQTEHRPKQEVHRVRINSSYICDAFAIAMGKASPDFVLDARDKAPLPGEIHVRPFKALLEYHSQLQQLSAKLGTNSNETSDDNDTDNGLLLNARPISDAKSMEEDPLDDPERKALIREHLAAFLEFMSEHLHSDLVTYRQLRSRALLDSPPQSVPKIAFGDLWKLFAPGDEIYSPPRRQAYKVLSVCGGRRSLRNRSSEVDKGEPGEGTISDFIITCFHLDFDGTGVGPVQQDISIKHFEGQRPILRLPVFPIEYADKYEALHKITSGIDEATENDVASKGSTVREQLIKRGEFYSELANKEKDSYAHKDYDGLSVRIATDDGRMQEVREQIDSEIIIDLDKFFQLYGESKPSLGLLELPSSDYRECTETMYEKCPCSLPDCRLNEVRVKLYDDEKVDEEKRDRIEKSIINVRRWRSVGESTLRAREYCLLFPGNIFAFVLKNRTWYELDVNSVDGIETNKQNFDDLILPDEHKRIVRSLANAHSLGPKAAATVTGPKGKSNSLREDLVRGKGKGLIVLLHGVPGVGKTSTAECVAELTRRPLFALTCGDLGESAERVQQKLQECFTLAYRWSCVMLLDEADVFLSARDKQDLKRNAVVSVFLRTLEYYSGILFLTTNRVGVFDEAFKSRIHVKLYYEPLTKDQSKKIWGVNFDRVKRNNPELVLDKTPLIKWAKKQWSSEAAELGRQWNGRQIHNAVRTAAALAAYDTENPNHLTEKHLETVAKASKEFDDYIKQTTGFDDIARAAQDLLRADPSKANVLHRRLFAPQNDGWNNGWNNTPSRLPQSGFEIHPAQLSKKKSKKPPTPPPQPAESEESSESSSED